jgi:osmotically-inducible protein OsmY
MIRKKVIGLALVAATVPLLQGCFPLAVTGAAMGSLVASDRRTTGTYVEDESIEWKGIAKWRDKFPGSHINATSFNRRVLLTGEVPSEDARKQVEEMVRTIENVKEVTNELQVAGASSIASRGSDSLVTSNVKARMVNNPRFSPTHIKVVTEASVVYLMGLVTQAEADAAVEITRTTSGVNRVVKVFEYISK